METPYVDRSWTSPDELTLHFRDYPGSAAKAPVLCLHGLTRNARDFADLAERIAPDRRVIVPEMRGRGESDYAKDSATYNPLTYVTDVEALLAQEEIGSFAVIGTSLGGLMTMVMAASDAKRMTGAVLNDIGPEVEQAGIERIQTYVGQGRSFPTWMHAARALQEVHETAYPDYVIDQWLEMAKRTMVLGQNGRISFDYDMAIADPFKEPGNAAPADLWPAYAALDNVPLLLLRGELSDLLSGTTVSKMGDNHSDFATVTVPRVGHAPTLNEPEAVEAILTFLARID